MASSRHLGRVVSLQVLYEYYFHKRNQQPVELEVVLERHLKYRAKELKQDNFTNTLVQGVVSHDQALSDLIQPLAQQRPLEDIPLVDQCLLKMGVYELLYGVDVPPKVAINEAVELAKHYGGNNSSKFINGVLGAVYRNLVKVGKIKADEPISQDGATGSVKI